MAFVCAVEIEHEHDNTETLSLASQTLYRFSVPRSVTANSCARYQISEGSPTLAMGFYPPRVFPLSIPFGNGTLIGWYPWPILVPGVLRLWEISVFPHHVAPLGFLTALLPSKSFWEDAHPWEIFPRLFPDPDIRPGHLRPPLPYLFPLCMHPCIINIFNFVPDCESRDPKNWE